MSPPQRPILFTPSGEPAGLPAILLTTAGEHGDAIAQRCDEQRHTRSPRWLWTNDAIPGDQMIDEDPRIEQLEEANHQLQESLKACHDLVAEYRGKLAANLNAPALLGRSEPDDEAESA